MLYGIVNSQYSLFYQQDQVLSTSYLAAAYVNNVMKMPESKKVYMIGMPGLLDEFKLMNINTIGIGVSSVD